MVDTIGDLTSALQTYIVSPLNQFGMGGYVFDTRTKETTNLNAESTDHYAEDNTAVQDHIAIKPVRIILRGIVGELVYTPNNDSLAVVQQVTQKLTEITGFLPQLDAAAVQAQAAISGIESSGATLQSFAATVPAAANIYALIQNTIGATSGNTKRQQSAYQYFKSCQAAKMLMGIQTPWEFLTNMTIESIVADQDDETIFTTDFSITFKQMRFAETLTAPSPLSGTGGIVPGGQIFAQGAAALQGAATTNNGVTSGVSLPSNLLPATQAIISSPASLLTNSLANVWTYQ